jgi:hypothetical protein
MYKPAPVPIRKMAMKIHVLEGPAASHIVPMENNKAPKGMMPASRLRPDSLPAQREPMPMPMAAMTNR